MILSQRVALSLLITCATFLPAVGESASRFETSFLSMDLPAPWECALQAGEWLCRDKSQAAVNRALVVVSAKEAAPEDTLESYRRFLKEPKIRPTHGGTPGKSKVLQTTDRTLNGHPWIESLHLGSEIDSYYTRYVATVAGPLAILVNFTVHKNYAAHYGPTFIKAISSLKIKSPIANRPADIRGSGTAPLPIAAQPSLNEIPQEQMAPASQNNTLLMLIVFGLVTLAFLFFIWRKR